ncbi:MAG: site-specific DNA-methyltransferase, partial [Clostridiaceae bacterium]|nr:site-specific DNA-methyltransferase [Clostridiaceae bacterium]
MSIELKFDKKDIKIYKGDNQEVLATLESGSIDLIYCDILYNSGKVFDDYNDDLGSAEQAIEWYRPRIKEMHRVLKDNGSIYIHCNWRLDSYIRILLDEIFGYFNFRNRIYRQHSEIRGFVENYDSQMDV